MDLVRTLPMAEEKVDQEALNDRLFDAVDNNDLGEIDAALAAGANIEASKVCNFSSIEPVMLFC